MQTQLLANVPTYYIVWSPYFLAPPQTSVTHTMRKGGGSSANIQLLSSSAHSEYSLLPSVINHPV